MCGRDRTLAPPAAHIMHLSAQRARGMDEISLKGGETGNEILSSASPHLPRQPVRLVADRHP